VSDNSYRGESVPWAGMELAVSIKGGSRGIHSIGTSGINERAQLENLGDRLDHMREDAAVEREVREARKAEGREHPGFWRRLARRLRRGAA
jgi:hypothetical protein